MRWFDFAEADH